MEQGKQRTQGASEKDDIVAIADGPREGLLVGIEAVQNAIEEGGRVIGFEVAVECEKLWEEGKDKCERDLF